MTKNSTFIEKAIISFAILTVIIPAAVFYSILPEPTLDNCITTSGFVSRVINGSGKRDIVIELQGDEKYYYINRGIERGLSVNSLSRQILNKDIEVMTIKHFSFFDPFGSTKHIAKISTGGVVVYSEM